MADNEQERKKPVPIASVKRAVPTLLVSVSALLEESGEIAPVDLGRFGKRAGQIIARGASTRHAGASDKSMTGRRSTRGYGAL
jgi:hypothetical protein